MSGTHIELVDLSKRYGAVLGLDHMSLQVEEGEFVSLLGPSGCGKSTTLGLLAGFLQPDTGSVWFGGRDMNGIPPHKRNVGMVFQSFALFPHLSVFENVAFGLRVRKTPREQITREVRRALDLVQLATQEGRYPRQLSGGQAQRVALARALVLDPPVLLLDEPLSNLDAKLRLEMRQELVAIQRRIGVTTIFVTHDQEEALSISDRVAVMNLGRVEQVGTPLEVYEHPASAFVARFIGSSNLIRGIVDNRQGSLLRVRVGEGRILSVPLGIGDRDLGVGDPVTIFVRPEHVRVALDDPQAPDSARNAVRARVRRVSYQGATKVYYLDHADGELRAMTLNINDDEAVQGGQRVSVSWPVEHGHLLAAESK